MNLRKRRRDRPPITERWRGHGRIRFDVPALISNPGLATWIEDLVVRNVEQVTIVKASPISGSLLVSYDPRSEALHNIPATLSALVGSLLEEYDKSMQPSIGVHRTALLRVLEVSGQRPGEQIYPTLLTVATQSLTTLQGLSLAAISTVATGGKNATLQKIGIFGRTAQIRALAVATIMLTSASLWTNYHRRRAWRRLSQSIEHRIRTAIFFRLLAQDLEFFESHGTGQLLAILVDDEAKIGSLIEEADILIESSLTVLFSGTALLRASPRLALIAGASIPVMLIPARWLTQKSRLAFSNQASLSADLNQTLDNILAGIVEVKSFTAEESEAQRVRSLSQKLATASIQASSFPALQMAIGGNVFYGGYTLAMAHGARRVIAGKMPEEQLNRASFWYPRLISSLGQIANSTGTYYSARNAAEHLQRVIDVRPRIRDGTIALSPTDVRGDITIEDVSFGYDPSSPVLRNVSLHLSAGETLAIVGPTGSGKSTLLRLLLRFYDPDEGRVLLDGHDLRDLRTKDLRSAIALVSQDVYLFNGSVRHNVLYGRPEATDDEVIEALAAAGSRDLLDSLPEGLGQDVGERGHRLSGGQRQRVAIARALLKSAPILALDEATSQLDYATEAVVKASLAIATSGRSVIFIAHRLASIRDADTIIVLDHGTILEQGTHQSLLERRGLYYELWQLQSGT